MLFRFRVQKVAVVYQQMIRQILSSYWTTLDIYVDNWYLLRGEEHKAGTKGTRESVSLVRRTGSPPLQAAAWSIINSDRWVSILLNKIIIYSTVAH